jgi:hypothetical protein
MSGADRCEETKREQAAAAELQQPGRTRVQTSRLQADRFEESGGPSQAMTTPDPEQLLCTVADEQEPDDQAEYQQTKVHSLRLLFDCGHNRTTQGLRRETPRHKIRCDAVRDLLRAPAPAPVVGGQ